MKYYLRFFFLTLSILMFSEVGFTQDNWVKYKADAVLSFSVEVPGEMEESTKTIKTAIGELNALTYAYQGTSEDPNYLYLINFVQYPEGTFPADSTDLIEDYLQNAVLTSADNVNGELVYSANIDENSGKLFRVKYNEGNAIIKGKSYIKEDVFISLQVFTVQSKSLNDEMDYFLDSFIIKL